MDARELLTSLVGQTILTLGPAPKKNYVRSIGTTSVRIDTGKSTVEGTEPEIEVAWFQAALDVLREQGHLDRYNLPDEVRRRSAAMFAVLAKHPQMVQERERVIGLRWMD